MLRLPGEISAVEVVRDRLMLVLHESDAGDNADAVVPLESLADRDFVLRPRGRGSTSTSSVRPLRPGRFQPAPVAGGQRGADTSPRGIGPGRLDLPASLQAIKVPDVTWRQLSVNAGTLGEPHLPGAPRRAWHDASAQAVHRHRQPWRANTLRHRHRFGGSLLSMQYRLRNHVVGHLCDRIVTVRARKLIPTARAQPRANP